MIADVNDADIAGKFLPELSPKQKKFIEVSEPFSHEAPRNFNPTEKWFWLNQLDCDSRRRQAVQHHLRKSLHALLLIGGVITDQ
jgi:hypothetical protein